MKRYKLLKDLPTFKAGEEFQLHRGGIKDYITLFKDDEQVYQFKVGENVSEMFNDWFEELPDINEYFYITDDGKVDFVVEENLNLSERRKAIGNIFETKEEAEKYLEYLKAKAIIKQDTKGFKPNWQDTDEDKWCGVWDIIHKEVSTHITWYGQKDTIYFKSKEDVEESFEKHPDEWKTYLTYEG